jgi:hypothetical protein
MYMRVCRPVAEQAVPLVEDGIAGEDDDDGFVQVDLVTAGELVGAEGARVEEGAEEG